MKLSIDIKTILLIISFAIIIVLAMSTTCSRQRLSDAQNNINALTDTIQTYKLKNGELMHEKQGYIAEKKDLEKYLEISKKDVKDLEKKLGSAIAAISKIEAQVKIDTIRITDSVYIAQDSTYHSAFEYVDDWTIIDGETTLTLSPLKSTTTINDISMSADLKIGTTEDNKWFVTTNNPHLRVSSIEGANVEKSKHKRWGMGPTITAGIGYGWGTDFKGGDCAGGLITGFMIGWSVHYDIFQW